MNAMRVDVLHAETSSAPPRAPAARAAGHPHRGTVRLYVRLIRRSALLMAASIGAYCALEVVSYRSAYPEGISPLQFAMFQDNPAVRMMDGVPDALGTAGGFAVGDGGWFMQLLIAVWVILVTTRFLRGEEEAERTDLLLARPIPATHVTALVMAVVASAGLLVGASASVAMLAFGEQTRGSILLGVALAGVCATFAAAAAVASQLVEVRRRAAALAAAFIGVAYVLRMVGNSTDGRSWVRWTTPLGWLEQLKPYGDTQLLALVPLLVVPLLLTVLAVWLRARRDTGAGLLAPEAGRDPHLRLLTSPLAFAWRSNRAVLLAWVLGLGVYAAIMGALVSTMIDWIAGDEGYQRILADLGLEEVLSVQGFLAMIGLMLGLAVCLQVSWRIAAARTEEESGRLEAVLARRVTRVRWLGGHIVLAALGGILLLAVLGSGMWLGAVAAGSDNITWSDAIRSALNTMPVVVLIGGLAVLAFGVLPRLTLALPVSVTVVAFVVSMLGPALSWPNWVLDLSPFTHLAMVPAEPWAATAGMVMACAGIALGVVGVLGFRRRDLVSG